jgi:hypothetical protein
MKYRKFTFLILTINLYIHGVKKTKIIEQEYHKEYYQKIKNDPNFIK